jgi:hypothetical protein
MSIEPSRRGVFEPDFDDTRWTEGWLRTPVVLPPVAVHPSGYRIERQWLSEVQVFGRAYRLNPPLDCRLLYDPAGRLWMSNTPQEHMMMYNNATRSWGHVLVGGLGLGLYPQYAAAGVAGQAIQFTVVERSPVVRELVEPSLQASLGGGLQVHLGAVEEYLAGNPRERYDTIFLDTWDTLDAAQLPAINRLRDLALPHVGPDGRLLLWGYRWMVRLFEDACRQLLALEPDQREPQLEAWIGQSPGAALLRPVADRFVGQMFDETRLPAALAWCRSYIVEV